MKTQVKLSALLLLLPMVALPQRNEVEIIEQKNGKDTSISYSSDEDSGGSIQLDITAYDKAGKKRSYSRSYESRAEMHQDAALRAFMREMDVSERSVLDRGHPMANKYLRRRQNIAKARRLRRYAHHQQENGHHNMDEEMEAIFMRIDSLLPERMVVLREHMSALQQRLQATAEEQMHIHKPRTRYDRARGAARHMKKVTAKLLDSDSPLLVAFKKQISSSQPVSELRYLPNPGFGRIRVSFKVEEGPTRLQISSLSGDFSQTIQTESAQDRYIHTLIVQDWAPDLYLLHIQQGNSESFLQLIVN